MKIIQVIALLVGAVASAHARTAFRQGVRVHALTAATAEAKTDAQTPPFGGVATSALQATQGEGNLSKGGKAAYTGPGKSGKSVLETAAMLDSGDTEGTYEGPGENLSEGGHAEYNGPGKSGDSVKKTAEMLNGGRNNNGSDEGVVSTGVVSTGVEVRAFKWSLPHCDVEGINPEDWSTAFAIKASTGGNQGGVRFVSLTAGGVECNVVVKPAVGIPDVFASTLAQKMGVPTPITVPVPNASPMFTAIVGAMKTFNEKEWFETANKEWGAGFAMMMGLADGKDFVDLAYPFQTKGCELCSTRYVIPEIIEGMCKLILKFKERKTPYLMPDGDKCSSPPGICLGYDSSNQGEAFPLSCPTTFPPEMGKWTFDLLKNAKMRNGGSFIGSDIKPLQEAFYKMAGEPDKSPAQKSANRFACKDGCKTWLEALTVEEVEGRFNDASLQADIFDGFPFMSRKNLVVSKQCSDFGGSDDHYTKATATMSAAYSSDTTLKALAMVSAFETLIGENDGMKNPGFAACNLHNVFISDTGAMAIDIAIAGGVDNEHLSTPPAPRSTPPAEGQGEGVAYNKAIQDDFGQVMLGFCANKEALTAYAEGWYNIFSMPWGSSATECVREQPESNAVPKTVVPGIVKLLEHYPVVMNDMLSNIDAAAAETLTAVQEVASGAEKALAQTVHDWLINNYVPKIKELVAAAKTSCA